MKRRVLTAVAMMAAVTPVMAAAEERPELKLVSSARDVRSGAEVRVLQGGPQEMQIEVLGRGVVVRKLVEPKAATVTVNAAGETLTIAVARDAMAVTARRRTVMVTSRNVIDLPAAQRLVAGFAGWSAATRLLRTMQIRQESPLQPLILSLRVLLESARGERYAAADLQTWHQRLQDRVVVRPVAQRDLTASQCWDEYAKEAIRAQIDYDHCVDGLSWYEVIDMGGCALVFDLRAVAAMAWYLRCVGLGINGAPLP